MAYRNGTYIAFHANGTVAPGESDMTYYRLLQSWHSNEAHDFTLVNSHDKASAVRDSSSRETLKRSLRERLSNSKNMLLIVGSTTRYDTDWVPFEIEEAIDRYKIPIIAAYTDYSRISAPIELRHLWPPALAARIDNGTARVIHVPFKQSPIMDAISQFTHSNLPKSGVSYYDRETYTSWGIP